ncbi:hypothetical protein GCM10009086_47050 [Pseudomonas rhodesiae]
MQDSNVLIDDQPWFSASDIGHLMGLHLDSALRRELDPNQQQTLAPIPQATQSKCRRGLAPYGSASVGIYIDWHSAIRAKQAPPHIFCVGYY